MKRVLAILLFVPFVMALAPPCHAAGNGEVAVSLVDVPAELRERSVLVTLGNGPNDTDAVLVTFYKQNEAVLQTYSRAASQLDKIGISLGTEPEKVRQLVTETESRIADLIAALEIVRKTNRAIQEDKEKVEQIQSG